MKIAYRIGKKCLTSYLNIIWKITVNLGVSIFISMVMAPNVNNILIQKCKQTWYLKKNSSKLWTSGISNCSMSRHNAHLSSYLKSRREKALLNADSDSCSPTSSRISTNLKQCSRYEYEHFDVFLTCNQFLGTHQTIQRIMAILALIEYFFIF